MSLGKIILKSTTKISLNDRFTVLRNEKPSSINNGHFDTIQQPRQIVQASRRNQRLAAQMERRPAVMAALQSKKNLQNRLNSQQSLSVKQRLALPGRLRVPESIRGSFRGSRRGQVNLRARGVRNKFLGRITTDNRPSPSSVRGRPQEFIIGIQRGRGGLRGRARGRGRVLQRTRGSSRIFRRGT